MSKLLEAAMLAKVASDDTLDMGQLAGAGAALGAGAGAGFAAAQAAPGAMAGAYNRLMDTAMAGQAKALAESAGQKAQAVWNGVPAWGKKAVVYGVPAAAAMGAGYYAYNQMQKQAFDGLTPDEMNALKAEADEFAAQTAGKQSLLARMKGRAGAAAQAARNHLANASNMRKGMYAAAPLAVGAAGYGAYNAFNKQAAEVEYGPAGTEFGPGVAAQEGMLARGKRGLANTKARAQGAVANMNPNLKRGLKYGLPSLAAAGLGAAAYNQFANKTASYNAYLDLPGDYALAKMAAEEMAQEAFEKLAYAEQLYAEADYMDVLEKQAADNGAGDNVSFMDQFTTPVGAASAAAGITAPAIAGYWAAAQGKLGPINTGMKGAVAGGLLGAGAVAAAGALNAFQEQKRLARAQELQAQMMQG